MGDPAGAGEDVGARGEGGGDGGPGGEDLAEGAGAHRGVEGDGGGVEALGGDGGVDPGALGGVVGEVEGAEEEFLGLKGRERGGVEGECWVGAGEVGVSDGAVGELPLGCLGGEGGCHFVFRFLGWGSRLGLRMLSFVF